jgi:rhodanese-related sulfurtransferase/rubrerythrin
VEISAEGIREIDSAEAATLMETSPEGAYFLLDVRQPQEYEEGHLPAARLVPLPELEEGLRGLERSQPVITYCRSGNRGRAAAVLLRRLGFGEVYSMAGGIKGWTLPVARGWPRVHLFTGAEDLVTALNLVFFMERGSENFYRTGAGRAESAGVARLLSELAAAEVDHMRRLYAWLARKVGAELPSFEEYHELADSDLMEAALNPEDYFWRVEEMAFADERHVLETAIELEVLSLDLYRSLAEQARDDEVRASFLELSDQEKAHLRALAEKLGEVAGRSAAR